MYTSILQLRYLDQTLILILIITQWIAPFGRVPHKKLAEKLLVYIGLGSDIADLLQLYEKSYVKKNDVLVYVIFAAWILSLT